MLQLSWKCHPPLYLQAEKIGCTTGSYFQEDTCYIWGKPKKQGLGLSSHCPQHFWLLFKLNSDTAPTANPSSYFASLQVSFLFVMLCTHDGIGAVRCNPTFCIVCTCRSFSLGGTTVPNSPLLSPCFAWHSAWWRVLRSSKPCLFLCNIFSGS